MNYTPNNGHFEKGPLLGVLLCLYTRKAKNQFTKSSLIEATKKLKA